MTTARKKKEAKFVIAHRYGGRSAEVATIHDASCSTLEEAQAKATDWLNARSGYTELLIYGLVGTAKFEKTPCKFIEAK